MLLVASLGCGVMSGMASGYLSLKITLEDYVQEMKYPDAVVETKVITRDVLDDIKKVPGVEAVDARMAGNLTLVGKDGMYYSMQAMTWSDEELQQTYYWEKSDEEAEYPILLEYRFALLNDIHAGDRVKIHADDRSWDCLISAVISRPEMIDEHKLGGIPILTTDIGYVYIPRNLLNKLENPDYEKASLDWEEGNRTYQEEKENAKEQYEAIRGEIDEAEKLLEEKKKELQEQIELADEQKEELIKAKEELEKKKKEWEEKKAELLANKKQLDQSEEEIKNGEKELASGKAELESNKKLLDSTKTTLEKTRAELNGKQSELNEKTKELEEMKALLRSGEKEIEKGFQELNENEKKLKDTKKEAEKKYDQLTTLGDTVVSLENYTASLSELLSAAEQGQSIEELIEKKRELLKKVIADSQTLEGNLKQLRKTISTADFFEMLGLSKEDQEKAVSDLRILAARIRSDGEELFRLLNAKATSEEINAVGRKMVREFEDFYDRYAKMFPAEDMDPKKLVARIDEAKKEIEDGLPLIEDGLKQIEEGRKLLQEKRKEAIRGRAEIEEGEKQLKAGQALLTDGFAQVEEGFASLNEGYLEYEKYLKQVQEKEKELNDGKAEYDKYYRQYLEAEKALREAKEMLTKTGAEVDSGLKQIDDAVEAGKKSLEEGEEEIRRSRNEAEGKWIDALNKFKDVESELQEAKEKLGEWKGYDVFINQIHLYISKEKDSKAVLAEVERVIGEENIKDSYTYQDSGVKYNIDVNLDPLETMSLLTPLLFFVISLIVELLFMSFLIRQSRREIGILRALGFSRKKIIGLFCLANALSSFGAIILGVFFSFIITRLTGVSFQDFYYLHYMIYAFHWERFLVAALLTLLVGQIATLVSAGYISHVQPSEAMTRPAPAAAKGEKGLLSHIKMPPFMKYCISSLLRNKKRLVFSIICLSSSVVLIFTAFSFGFSKNKVLSEHFDDRIHFDCEIYLSERPDADFMERLNQSGLIQEAETVSYYTREIEANGIRVERVIKALPRNTELISIFDEDRRRIYTPEEGILLEQHTAEPIHVSAGDTVLIDGIPVLVSGVSLEHDDRYQYVSDASADFLGEPDMFSVMGNVTKENETKLLEYLSKEDGYIYTAFTDKIFAGVEGWFKAFDICVILVIVSAILIGSVIVVNTLRTNLQDQKKELCVLRTLGFQQKSLSVRLMTQAAVYYVLSGMIGIPCGIAVTKQLLKTMELEERSYPYMNDIRVYLLALLIVLAYMVFSHFISMRAIRKWDIVETVKDKE